jgi:hypothetical protein
MDPITPQEYNAECISLAEEADGIARTSLAEGNSESDAEEARETWLHETIDGHQWVIYTYYNFFVLAHSENDSAFTDEFGTEGVVRDGNINWAALAYMALLADVRERLSDVGELAPEESDEDEKVGSNA